METKRTYDGLCDGSPISQVRLIMFLWLFLSRLGLGSYMVIVCVAFRARVFLDLLSWGLVDER